MQWRMCLYLDLSTINSKGWQWGYCSELGYRVRSIDCRACTVSKPREGGGTNSSKPMDSAKKE